MTVAIWMVVAFLVGALVYLMLPPPKPRYTGRHRGKYVVPEGITRSEYQVDDVALAMQKLAGRWGHLADIPLPDLPFTWTPRYHVTQGSLRIEVVPDDPLPDGVPQLFGKDWFFRTGEKE